MKYRIQFSGAFDNTNSNAILNEMESAKAKVFSPTGFTQVPIERKGKKLEYLENNDVPTEYASIDFDAIQATHSVDDGQAYYEVNLDLSFDVEQDFLDCINYLETIKNSADNTKAHSCRHFECNHDEIPLVLDGSYTYMDFMGTPIVY